jgi:hypothetical protein
MVRSRAKRGVSNHPSRRRHAPPQRMRSVDLGSVDPIRLALWNRSSGTNLERRARYRDWSIVFDDLAARHPIAAIMQSGMARFRQGRVTASESRRAPPAQERYQFAPNGCCRILAEASELELTAGRYHSRYLPPRRLLLGAKWCRGGATPGPGAYSCHDDSQVLDRGQQTQRRPRRCRGTSGVSWIERGARSDLFRPVA